MPSSVADEVEATRPARPASVELAAAILTVGGVMDVIRSALIALSAPPVTIDERLATGVPLAVGLLLVVLGILVRSGRAWLVTLNVAAVLAFLQVASASVPGLVFGALDVLVVALLLRARWWFQWSPPMDEDGPASWGRADYRSRAARPDEPR